MPEADGGSGASADVARHVAGFIGGLRLRDVPVDVVVQAQRCLLDLIGVAAAGAGTRAARMIIEHAAMELRSVDQGARVLFDGRISSRAGAAFAGAATIDAFDAHDGHVLTKGHAGVAVLPALLAFLDGARPQKIDAGEFITSLVLGYEIGTRAGIALHATVADYHCSGAWNALACAAVGARRLGLDVERTRHALGIAEYFGPRGQMLRVCASPTMVKDGSGWGAHAGVTAALLAARGFTGAPAFTVETDSTSALWSDLGRQWRTREQYFKAYPVCRWAQPAIEAALELGRDHEWRVEDITAVHIQSFREAVLLGADCAYPQNTEEAQYSLAYPVAAALAGDGARSIDVGESGLRDPRVRRVFECITLTEDSALSRLFPAERWARIRITLRDGRVLASEAHQARGGPENTLSDDDLRMKYRDLAEPVLGSVRARTIERLVDDLLTDPAALPSLVETLLSALPPTPMEMT